MDLVWIVKQFTVIRDANNINIDVIIMLFMMRCTLSFDNYDKMIKNLLYLFYLYMSYIYYISLSQSYYIFYKIIINLPYTAVTHIQRIECVCVCVCECVCVRVCVCSKCKDII